MKNFHLTDKTSPVTRRGKIVDWNAAKGFGFADDGHMRTFVHIGDFSERIKRPEIGDELSYTLGKDSKGRTCGRDIVMLGTGGRLRLAHLPWLALLLALPCTAIWHQDSTLNAQRLSIWMAIASLGTFALYAWDKRRARRGGIRVSETMLHLLEFHGGWPGAFLAQRALRHKSSKFSYQVTFWLIVAFHQYIATDFLLDWRIYSQVKVWIASYL
jgi:uncharacterized membrane protein YsdA (DUF1294 family)/cold shock CspA family protein